MDLLALRVVAAIDAANVLTLTAISPRHALAGAAGFAPAAAGVALVHLFPRRRRLARALCAAGLIPNTALSLSAAGGTRRSRCLALYVGVGGALLGAGYLAALRRQRE
ncbi:hypothetical protein GCM10009840_05810 [Pseudolysinimonas kribbensis]|jgi:hypothetical protein|uniref:Uncharacterized protein n=1 Tax=Pseudolysinimonas kribbensis TaxID=433641 RepID=A0ABQ6K2T4_9MICO|nr:hypothetical protein [Pseudolysinimonas kribbensis]GMA94935.1 hypothetical protein GCM10025881_17590 [Pseudolysinimonas kribbensis]